MKKSNWIWLGIFFIAVIAAKFIFFPSKTSAKKSPPNKKINVGVTIVKGKSVNEILQVTGSVLPMEEVVLQPETQGRIVGIYFQEGAWVKKGQLLVKINDSELQAQKNKLQILLKNAKVELSRLEKLLPINATSKEAYDLSLTQVSSLEADLALNEAQIEKTEIRAPFDGQIGNRWVSPGATVSVGTPIAKIYQLGNLKAEFQLPATYRDRISVYTQFKLTTSSGFTSKGSIYAIEPMADLSGRTFAVKGSLPNSSKIHSGDFAKIEVFLDVIPEAINIPTEAIVPVLKGQQVYIVKNGKAQPVNVAIGQRNDTSVRIISGLQLGDSVISSGLMYVKPNTSVHIIKIQK